MLTIMIADTAQQWGKLISQYAHLSCGAIKSKTLHDAWCKANLRHDIHTIMWHSSNRRRNDDKYRLKRELSAYSNTTASAWEGRHRISDAENLWSAIKMPESSID